VAIGGGWLDRALRHPALVRLSEASYAIYILHIPVNNWLLRLDKHTLDLAASRPTLLFVAYLANLLIVSVAVLNLIEEPRRYLRNRLCGGGRRAASRFTRPGRLQPRVTGLHDCS
jgi:peptidoglycan/LPS O-acetylase OafA/YrhL